MAYGRRRQSSISDVFTLSPLPYPVLLILALISIFLGISWYFSYESTVEAAEKQMSWAIIAAPIVLLIAVHWLSSIENPEQLFGFSPYDRRKRSHYRPPSEGTSPWGVAALIVLLLIMVSYQSTFHDSWFI